MVMTGEHRAGHIDRNIYKSSGAFEVRAVYSVYDDAGFTTPSADHGAAEDIYRFTSEPSFVQTIIDKLITSTNSILAVA